MKNISLSSGMDSNKTIDKHLNLYNLLAYNLGKSYIGI